MKKSAQGNVKNIEIIAFTIIESIFVLLAVAIISIILAGLLLKNSELPAPTAVGTIPKEEPIHPAP